MRGRSSLRPGILGLIITSHVRICELARLCILGGGAVFCTAIGAFNEMLAVS